MKRFAMLVAAGLVGALVVLAGEWALAGPGRGGSHAVPACYDVRYGMVRVDVADGGCGVYEASFTLGGVVTRRVVATGSLPSPGFRGATAECRTGEVVLGGGFEVESINPDIGVVTNAPITLSDGRQAWQVTMFPADTGASSVAFRAVAICAPGKPGK